jgi:hypothetical protein
MKITEKSLRKSLIERLTAMGADVDVFRDMIEKYVELWRIDAMLTEDIKERGVMYKDFSSVGVEMMKNNPSVKEKVMVNRQMLSILNQLNISTDAIELEDDVDSRL